MFFSSYLAVLDVLPDREDGCLGDVFQRPPRHVQDGHEPLHQLRLKARPHIAHHEERLHKVVELELVRVRVGKTE